MAHILVTYGTTEGQTAKVAQHVANVGKGLGHRVQVMHAAELPDDFRLDGFDAALLAASVHEGRHQRYIARFARDHRQWLDSHPSGFLSVCLAAASSDLEEQEEADELIDRFAERTGWHPKYRLAVAGALRYSEYNWLKRFVMKRIAAKEGGGTDTSQDYEYTDWEALTVWCEVFYEAVTQSAEASRSR